MTNFKMSNPISWTAILAGAIVGVGLNFLFNLLSLGLAIASFSVSLSGKTFFSLTGFMFFGLFAIIAMFASGWVAGKLSPQGGSHPCWGVLIGFLAWSVLLMLTIVLITNMIQFIAFHGNFTSNLVAIKLSNDAPMLTQTLANKLTDSPLSLNVELGKKVITLNAFLTFILFFLGSTASCAGGFLGYHPPSSSSKKDE